MLSRHAYTRRNDTNYIESEICGYLVKGHRVSRYRQIIKNI
jgi:hypothetical protein